MTNRLAIIKRHFYIDTTHESRNNTSNKCFLSPNTSTSWESGASG